MLRRIRNCVRLAFEQESSAVPPILEIQDDIEQLGYGQHLLLWAFRATAMGHADCPTLRRAFHAACCGLEDEALMALMVVVRTLGFCGRRKMRLHVPGCRCVSPDERTLLLLFAAAKTSVEMGDETEIRAELFDLVDPSLSGGVLLALQTVTSAIETHGHTVMATAFGGNRPERILH